MPSFGPQLTIFASPMYLNCKTYYSCRYGTFSPAELVAAAKQLKLKTLALTNINSTADAWHFVKLCRQQKIEPILGAEIRGADRLLYILIARDDAGFKEINDFISYHNLRGESFPSQPDFERGVFVIYPLGTVSAAGLREHEYIGVRPSEINKLFSLRTDQYPLHYVILQPVTFQSKRYFHLHRLLRSVDLNTVYTQLRAEDIAAEDEMFRSEGFFESLFGGYPEILARTNWLLSQCAISTDLKTDKGLSHFGTDAESDRAEVRRLAFDGLKERYAQIGKDILERLEKELRVIDEQGFNAYYLMVADIIKFARRKSFFYVGRGSGANSLVAYLMFITDVDPIKLDLYFERFLNEFRSSPPDFDIDFSHRDRDEVINYVFSKYGKEHVALLGMYSTFQRKAIIRELGKVMGLPKSEIDQLVRNPGMPFDGDSKQTKILQFGGLMRNFPNHHSIHAGGILVADKPLTWYSAQELPPKGFSTSQLDLFFAEDVGLIKLDLLSQRGLGHIKDALAIIRENRGIDVDISRIEDFMADPVVAARLAKADTIGCFYIESPAMRQLLLKLRCDNYLTLVAASSIIRPGVSASGMMRTYIENYHRPDRIKYIHPKLEELLKETYGVMIYQEDVIKVAHHFAGLDMAEADILRRAMSGKYRGQEEMLRLKERFMSACSLRGYTKSVAEEVWRQISSFSGYSFSKAHSASFAVESYQSLYLKTYFPMEFMVGVINNFGGFYNTELYFQELKRAGAELRPPCVNESGEYTRISGQCVYVGLVHIEKLSEGLRQRIIDERRAGGKFIDLSDFIGRTGAAFEQVSLLIRAGAFSFTGGGKKELLWQVNFFLERSAKQSKEMPSLFAQDEPHFKLPELSRYDHEDAVDEIEILGFSLGDLFALADVDRGGSILVKDLPGLANQYVKVFGKLVTTKDSYTRGGEHMTFGTFLDMEGNWLDTVHWPRSLKDFPFQGKGFYVIEGTVAEDFNTFSLNVVRMQKVGLKI